MGLAQKVILNASVLAAGRLAMSGLSVVTVAIATRYLGLDAYGHFATATALILIVGTLNDLGLWSVGTREVAKRPEETDRLLGALVTIGLIFSLVGTGVAIAFGYILYGGEDDAQVREAIVLLALVFLTSAPFGAIGAFFNAQQKAYVGVIGGLTLTVVTLALVAAAAAFDLGYRGVVLAYVIAGLAQAAVMIGFAWGKVRLRPVFDRALCKQLLLWALPVGGTLVVWGLYWRIDLVILSQLSTAAEVALYAVAFKIAEMVMGLPNYIHITLMPELARAVDTRERFNDLMNKIATVLFVGGLGFFVLFIAFATELAVVAGGRDFENAGPLLQILAFALAIAWLDSAFGDAFFVNNKQKTSFMVILVVVPVNIALTYAFIQLWEARGAAVAWGLSGLVILVVHVVLYRHWFSTLPWPRRAPQILAAGCVMAGVAGLKLLPGASEIGPAVTLVVGGTLSVATYVAALYALKAMPHEIHAHVVLPLASRLGLARPRSATT